MEIIRGHQTSIINGSILVERLSGYQAVHIDIGTGDGRFVQHLAQAHPNHFVIGIDASRENLRQISRRAPANALFIIANAQKLPAALHGLATHVTINFPWGSLLQELLENDSALMAGLIEIARSEAEIEVRLNAGALATAGWSLEAGAAQVRDVLAGSGFNTRLPHTLLARELRSCPTTWAKRLAFGRDPRAVYLYASRNVETWERIAPMPISA